MKVTGKGLEILFFFSFMYFRDSFNTPLRLSRSGNKEIMGFFSFAMKAGYIFTFPPGLKH